MLRFAALFLAVAGTAALTACSSADPNGTPLAGDQGYDAGINPSSNGAGGGATQCTPSGAAPAPQDPASLPACCATGQTGAAHCVATNDVPTGVASALATCPTGVCVPDPFIKNPSYKPPTCKSLNGADGVCLSVCVPQVAQYASLLPQDSCGADEKCAPCISPLDHKPTGACDIGSGGGGGGGSSCTGGGGGGGGSGGTGGGPTGDGGGAPAQCPHQGPSVLDPNSLPSCDPAGGAHCLNASLVPPAMASQLATCATGLCVPDVFIAAGGNFIPPTCRSLDNAEGRCLHEAIPQVAQQKAQLPQSTCQSFERCVPCYDPLTGNKTGACNLSCDPGPKEPPKTFASCCVKNNAPQGKCIPTSQIPAAEAKNLDTDTCVKNQELCVPTEMIPASFKPTACTGSTLLTGSYTGVCLSKCLHFGFIQSLGISQGSCDNLHDCAPCKNPLTGQPTGAPGCPP